jgi:pimeloyl-ACP methyl ester carboxylesterase
MIDVMPWVSPGARPCGRIGIDPHSIEATSMLSAFAVVFTAAATVAAGGREAPLLRGGGDPARGLLVNHTSGLRPFDPPDPARPTVVFIHGFNPLPRVVHFEMSQRVAESFDRRGGPAFNVLAWDWNSSTFESLHPGVNSEAAIHQGHALALALWRAGIDPARTHLIGHSAGGIVATSAARSLARGMGRPAAQLTLLDPAAYYHSIVFERLEAGSLCPSVENYWSPGPSAYGKEVHSPGVRNYRVAPTASIAGVFRPLRSDHLSIVRWYLGTIERPERPWGFNTSSLLDQPGFRRVGASPGRGPGVQ